MRRFTERREPTKDAPAHADVVVEVAQMTFHNLLPQLTFSGIGVVGLTVLLGVHYHNDVVLYAIAFAMLTVIVLRMIVVTVFKRRDKAGCTIRTAYQFQLIYAIGTLVYCCCIAGCILYSFAYLDSTSWTLCILATFMVSAAFMNRISLHTRLVQASGLIMVLALGFSFIRLRDSIDRFGFIPICFFGLVFNRSVQERFDSTMEQIRGRRRLRLLAEQDSLTGLANRRHFETILQSFCCEEMPFAVLFIDLDRFKAVNDTFGHPTGDALLQEVGRRLQATARANDIVARLGGDEFAILQAPVSTRSSAEALAQRIVTSIAKPFEIDRRNMSVGTSIGIRLSGPGDKDPNVLMGRVDQALYRAKQAGRGGFVFDGAEHMQTEGLPALEKAT